MVSFDTEPLSGAFSMVLGGGCEVGDMEVSTGDEYGNIAVGFGGVLSPTCANGLLPWVWGIELGVC